MTLSLAPQQSWDPLPAEQWNQAAAQHLLRRAGWSAVPAEVVRAAREGLPATLERLFPERPVLLPEPELIARDEERTLALQQQAALASAGGKAQPAAPDPGALPGGPPRPDDQVAAVRGAAGPCRLPEVGPLPERRLRRLLREGAPDAAHLPALRPARPPRAGAGAGARQGGLPLAGDDPLSRPESEPPRGAEREFRARIVRAVPPRRGQLFGAGHQGIGPRLHRLPPRPRGPGVSVRAAPARRRAEDDLRPDRQLLRRRCDRPGLRHARGRRLSPPRAGEVLPFRHAAAARAPWAPWARAGGSRATTCAGWRTGFSAAGSSSPRSSGPASSRAPSNTTSG